MCGLPLLHRKYSARSCCIPQLQNAEEKHDKKLPTDVHSAIQHKRVVMLWTGAFLIPENPFDDILFLPLQHAKEWEFFKLLPPRFCTKFLTETGDVATAAAANTRCATSTWYYMRQGQLASILHIRSINKLAVPQHRM